MAHHSGDEHTTEDHALLYDAWQLIEWPEEKEIIGGLLHDENEAGAITSNVKRLRSSIARWTLSTARVVGIPVRSGSPCSLPLDLIKLINNQGSWLFMLSHDSRFLAILQDNCLEIRSSKEDFNMVIGRCPFTKDLYPQWRKLAWSQYDSTIAYSDSDGTVHVCDLKGILLFSFQEQIAQPDEDFDYSKAISGLVFIGDEIAKQKETSLHLLIVTYSGQVSCIDINNTYEMGYKVAFRYDFTNSYPNGVSSVVYDKAHSLVIVGGFAGYRDTAERVSKAIRSGLSAWRLSSDSPHLKFVELISERNARARPSLLRRLSVMPSGIGQTLRGHAIEGIYCIVLSPCGKHLAAVHLNGSLSMWEVPSLRHKRTWRQEDHPHFDDVNPEANKGLGSKKLKESPVNITDCNWWNESAVILARCSGSLTVVRCVENQLINLFGDQCEWMEPAPRVSSSRSEGFLALECETAAKTLKRQRTESADQQNEDEQDPDPFLEDSDNEERPGFAGRLLDYTKSSIYDLTEIEYFRPPRKRPKLVTKRFRLISLSKTTPENLFERKLEAEEYGEALALAQKYNLDSDRVFQRQWRKSPVSLATIQDYLSKVSKLSWVLLECCERVPEELDAAKELLNFALIATDINKLANAGTSAMQTVSDTSDMDSEDEEEYDGFDVAEQRRREIKQRERFVRKWARKVDLENLTLQQKEMIRTRRKVFKYQDRLSTYECLLGGYDAARERYNHKDFQVFRQQEMLATAVERARVCNWRDVDTLLVYHGNELREHRLPILSNFPKTLSPSEYKSMLPEYDGHEIISVMEDNHRDIQDWCEDEKFQNAVTPLTDYADPSTEFYQENEILAQFRTDSPSLDCLRTWYMLQAVQMDLDARDIEGAISILKYGLERGVDGLEGLLRDFKALDMLVYECGYDPGITLTQLQEKTHVERLTMLLSQSSKEMYVKNIHRWAIPFLQMCEEEKSELASTVFDRYVTSIGEEDLTLPELVFTSFIVDRSMPAYIANLTSLTELALKTVYLNSLPDQLDSVIKIHACLNKISKSTIKNTTLREKINTVGRHVFACKILHKYNVKVMPSHIREVEYDRIKVQKLFIRLSRTAGGREPSLSKNEWNSLLADMLQLKEKIIVNGSSIEAAVCLEVFVESLLTSGSIPNLQIAGERMKRTADEEHSLSKRRLYTAPQKLSYESSVSLVVKSSQEYFDASTPNSNDNMLSLARECLLLITDQPSVIRDKLDLIEGVVLLQRFGVEKLPLQVRLLENRLKLIEMALDGEDQVYRKTEQLLRLGKLLRVCGSNKNERTGKILTMIINKALDCCDYQTAFCLCQELIAMPYVLGWIPCLRLAGCKEFDDVAGKRSVLSFAVCYCDGDKLRDVIDQMKTVNYLLIQQAAEEQEKKVTLPKTELETNEINDNEENNFSVSTLDRLMTTSTSFLSRAKIIESTAKGTKAVLSATGNVLSATTHTTKAVLTNVGNTQWWKRTIDHTLSVLPGSEMTPEEKEYDDVLTNEDFEYQGCPLFYADIVENSVSKFGINLCTLAYYQTSDVALAQAKLQCIQLQKQVNHVQPQSFDEASILKELVAKVLPYDFPLGLSYLFTLSDPEQTFSVLQTFPISALSIQISLYHFSLCFLLRYSSDLLSLKRASMYEIEPMKLIEKAVAIATNEHPTENLDPIRDSVITLKEQLLDYAQGEKLQGLGRGIDLGRFTKDLEYREETILGLAMTSDEDQYKFAVSLAHRSGTDLWLVLVTHLEFLFTECQGEMECAALHLHIKKLNMVPELVTRPNEFQQRMDRYVFPFISGKDHDRLHLYFSLINECKDDDKSFVSTHNLVSVPASNHIKMLKKIKSVTPELDYKALITDDVDQDKSEADRIINILFPVLNADTVPMLAKLVPKLPYCHHQISSSSLYLKVAEKQCWGDLSAGDGVDLIHNYESCNNLLRMLNPQNLLNFFQDFLFLSSASSLLTQKERQEVIKRGVKLCKIQGTKERKKQLEEDILSGQSFQDVLPAFIQMSKHLDTYSTKFLFDMVKNSKTDEKMANYLKLYDQTVAKPEEILNLASLMLYEGQSPFFIQNFLAIVPNKVCQPIDVLRKTIEDITQKFDKHKKQEVFDILSSLICSISSHMKQNGKVMTSKQVIELLRPFCEDLTVDVQLRVDILQILEDQFEIEDSEAKLLLHHRTQALIRAGWGEKILNDFTEKMKNKETSIADSVGRRAIFERLLEISREDLERLKHLVQLLIMWPAFEDANSDNSLWTVVLTAMADQGAAGGKEILNIIRENAQKLSQGIVKVIYEKLMKCELTFFAIKIILLAGTKDLYAEIPDALKSVKCMGPSQCDEELLTLLLESGMAPDTVETIYYPRVTEYLLSGNCANAEAYVTNLARQLQDRGYMAEAGALLMNYRGMHPAFRTFSNALSSLSRWLHS